MSDSAEWSQSDSQANLVTPGPLSHMPQEQDRNDEEANGEQRFLLDIFANEQEELLLIEVPKQITKKRAPTYRSYMGGTCENCGEPLGFIEVEGGRDRHYCNATCRVQHHRKLKCKYKH